MTPRWAVPAAVSALVVGAMVSTFGPALCGATGAPGLTAGTEATVALAPGGGTMRVYLPANYRADRQWPAIFFYHGMGGSPDTSWLRTYTEGRDYIIVGMPYLEGDGIARTAAEQERYLGRELENFHAACGWLAGNASVAAGRIFLAGISKGGWIVCALGERDLPRLAGMIVVLAGRPPGAPPPGPGSLRGKAIYVGAGELDPNLVPARRAAAVYGRNGGAVVTFEEYAGLGHEAPAAAPRLRAWLAVNGRYHQDAARRAASPEVTTEINQLLARALAAPAGLARYDQVLDLAGDPRLWLCDEPTFRPIRAEFVALRAQSPGREEWAAQLSFDDLLCREASLQHLAEMKAVLDGYEQLARTYPQTRFGKLAAQYAPRLAAAYQKSVEATRNAALAQQAAAATNAVTVVPSNFGNLHTGPEPIPVPIRRGNRIIFGDPANR